MAKQLWEIKYRPSNITEYLFQDDAHKELIQKFIADGAIPHLLLTGHRGTGKTSLAMVLKNELSIDDSDFLVINASDENNVDTMRTKIKGFISTYAMSKFKLVLLDEADYLSQAAQAILRNMMEEFSDNARFILSCNRGNKIIPEIRSRCFELLFKRMDKSDMLERMAIILKSEKVKASMDTLTYYADLAYPDMRKAVQLIQSNSVDGELVKLTKLDATTEINLRIIKLMEKNDFSGIRDVISGNMSDDDWEQLYTFIYTYLHEIGKFTDDKKWKNGIIILAEHLYKHALVADPEINAVAMFLRLGDI